jgi:DNA-directed RNA polymerase specialized sigma24 family protein
MQTDISNLRDDQLLGLIRRRHEDPDAAGDAWRELYQRHVKFVHWRVERATSFVGRGLVPEDIVEQTFTEVYLRAADGFNPGEYTSDDDARRHVRAWLGKVAHFELLGAIQSRAHESIIVRDPELLSFRVDRPHPGELADGNPSQGIVDVSNAAQSVLSPDELEIVWLKMHYYDPETGESWVPAADQDMICAKQGLSKPAFRKRYERALLKIKDSLVSADQASRPYNRRI